MTGVASGSGGAASSRIDDTLDDSALDNALSDDDDDFGGMSLGEQLSGIDSVPPADVPPRETLYSTPLSWERPLMGFRMDPLMGYQTPTLTEAEQRRLIAIAMGTGSSMGGLGSNVNNNLSGGLGSSYGMGSGVSRTTSLSEISKSSSTQQRRQQTQNQQPQVQPQTQTQTQMETQTQTQQQQPRPNPPSRTNTDDGTKARDKLKPGDRTAHNDIERKYRTNLKDKIAELRDAVPSLRTIPEDTEDGDTAAPSRAPKVSKVSFMAISTMRIIQTER